MFGRKKEQPAAPEPGAARSPQAAAAPAGPAKPQAPAGDGAAKPVSPEEAKRQAAIAIRHSLAFAQMVSVLMRSPHYKHYTLADLEWLVIPPLLTGQFSLAEARAQEGGPSIAVAVVLWASVSPEVDKRLSENLSAPIRLRPDEWRSGDILWLVDAVGDARVVPQFLKQLGESAWKGREVKLRRAENGKVVVGTLPKVG